MHIMAIDNSGSTGESASKYWAMVKDIIKNAPEDTQYILWNSAEIEDFTRKEHIPGKGGTGCTDPRRFIHMLKNRLDLHLTLITDGQIAPYGGQPTEEDMRNLVTECEEQLQNLDIQFSTLTMYFISTDPNNQSMDLSVAAPFIKRANIYQTQVYEMLTGKVLENAVEEKFKEFGMSPLDASNKELYNNIADGLRDTLVLNEEKSTKKQTRLDLNKYLNNPQLFIDEAEEISKKIHLENAGSQPEEEKIKALIQSLEELKLNLHQKITIDNKKIIPDTDINQIRLNLANNHIDAAKQSIKDKIAKLSKVESNAKDLRPSVNKHIDKRVAMLTKNFGRRVPKICSHHATYIKPRFVRRPPRTGPFWAARSGYHHDLTA